MFFWITAICWLTCNAKPWLEKLEITMDILKGEALRGFLIIVLCLLLMYQNGVLSWIFSKLLEQICQRLKPKVKVTKEEHTAAEHLDVSNEGVSLTLSKGREIRKMLDDLEQKSVSDVEVSANNVVKKEVTAEGNLSQVPVTEEKPCLTMADFYPEGVEYITYADVTNDLIATLDGLAPSPLVIYREFIVNDQNREMLREMDLDSLNRQVIAVDKVHSLEQCKSARMRVKPEMSVPAEKKIYGKCKSKKIDPSGRPDGGADCLKGSNNSKKPKKKPKKKIAKKKNENENIVKDECFKEEIPQDICLKEKSRKENKHQKKKLNKQNVRKSPERNNFEDRVLQEKSPEDKRLKKKKSKKQISKAEIVEDKGHDEKCPEENNFKDKHLDEKIPEKKKLKKKKSKNQISKSKRVEEIDLNEKGPEENKVEDKGLDLKSPDEKRLKKKKSKNQISKAKRDEDKGINGERPKENSREEKSFDEQSHQGKGDHNRTGQDSDDHETNGHDTKGDSSGDYEDYYIDAEASLFKSLLRPSVHLATDETIIDLLPRKQDQDEMFEERKRRQF